MDRPDQTTHFGFRDVTLGDKQTLVNDVFHSVASKYDLMNDLMSFGLHRLWKRLTIKEASAREGQCVLDIAGGTGDLSKVFAKQVGANGRVFLADINEKMLQQGRTRLIDEGIVGNIEFVQAD